MENCLLRGGRVFGNRYQKSVKNHVNFIVESSHSKNKMAIDAVGFGLWEKYCYVKENMGRGTKIDLIFILERDSRSRSKNQKVRLNVLDIRVSE